MFFRCFLSSCFFLCTINGSAQDFFAGTILNAQNGEALPYANIYNISSGQGTISNAHGYFRMELISSTDTIRISYIGFETLILSPGETENLKIRMMPASLELREVTVIPSDDTWLYDLLARSGKALGDEPASARAYYNLKSFVNKEQVELVEGYYNASLTGVDLNHLSLKAGRIALRPAGDRVFISFESSKAISAMRLGEKQLRFPLQPLELNKPQMRRAFYLSLEEEYLNDAQDSVVVIRYVPKDSSGNHFSGMIWVNKESYALEKITMQCPNAKMHPFDPLFPGDSIHRVNFQITKTFELYKGTPVFRHIDFFYEIDYQSRVGEEYGRSFTIRTEAVLYAYQFGNPFQLPAFEFHPFTSSDYWQIHTFPYNTFFWDHHTEYGLHDKEQTQDFFARHKYISLQQTFSLADASRPVTLFEKPFRVWSADRVGFRETIPAGTLPGSFGNLTAPERCHLGVKIFADMNVYGDSMNVLTATIFDPFESRCNLPMDARSNCFVNMYFDYCEILRREFEAELVPVRNELEFTGKHAAFVESFDRTTKDFLQKVKYGQEKKPMEEYNALILAELGIDNIAIFRPFDEQE